MSIWVDTDRAGIGFDIGERVEEEGPFGMRFEGKGPGASGKFGGWRDEEDGSEHVGVDLEANMFEEEVSAGDFKLGMKGPGGSARFDLSDSGLSMPELGVHLAEFDMGYQHRDADSANDHAARFGVSFGLEGEEGGEEGLPLRLHYGDADHDGHREYGYGLSAPILPGVELGMDYTTETPVADIAAIALMGPLGMPVNMAMHMMGAGDYAPGTLLAKGADRVLGHEDEIKYGDRATYQAGRARGMDHYSSLAQGALEERALTHNIQDVYEKDGAMAAMQIDQRAFRKDWVHDHMGATPAQKIMAQNIQSQAKLTSAAVQGAQNQRRQQGQRLQRQIEGNLGQGTLAVANAQIMSSLSGARDRLAAQEAAKKAGPAKRRRARRAARAMSHYAD